MGVRSRSGGPQPKDAAWLAEQVRLDAEVARQVDHVEDIVSHVGNRELERRAAEAARRYAQKAFLHDNKDTIRRLREAGR